MAQRIGFRIPLYIGLLLFSSGNPRAQIRPKHLAAQTQATVTSPQPRGAVGSPNSERASPRLVLAVARLQVVSGLNFPYDGDALEANFAKYLDDLFARDHRIARFYVRLASDQPANGATGSDVKPAYILQLEITAWNGTKFPPEVTFQDALTDTSSEKKVFTTTDAVLDDGSGDFPDLMARVLAERIYTRFAARAHDPRPAASACLTEGCRSLTLAWRIGGVTARAALGAAVAAAEAGSGSNSSARRRRRGRSSRSAVSRQRSGNILPYGPNPERDADEYGYVPVRYQKRFIERTLGLTGCYDVTQRPTREQMKLLDDVTTQLKQGLYSVPNFYWTVLYVAQEPRCINSFSLPPWRTIFLYSSLMNTLHWNRDEIAAVLGHEAGHLQDRWCGVVGDPLVVVSLTTLRGMEQVCEKHADNIGIQYVLGGGFDPTRFAYAFAAMENVIPEGESKRKRLFSSHPINRDRIANVSSALDALCKSGVARACQFLPLGTTQPAGQQ